MSKRAKWNQRPDSAVTVTGVAWYRADQYPRLLETAADAPDLEATYDEWRRSADRTYAEIEAQGILLRKVEVDVEDLISWCQARGRPLNGATRAAYTAEKLRETDLKRGE